MKVQDIKSSINEAVNKKLKLDEDAFFEGYNFITHGKEITLVDIDLPLVKVDKDTVVIKWTGKPDFRNNGVYGFNIDVKSLTANNEEDGAPLNFNGFEFVISKRKNPEVEDVQVFIENVYILTQEKRINIDFVI